MKAAPASRRWQQSVAQIEREPDDGIEALGIGCWSMAHRYPSARATMAGGVEVRDMGGGRKGSAARPQARCRLGRCRGGRVPSARSPAQKLGTFLRILPRAQAPPLD